MACVGGMATAQAVDEEKRMSTEFGNPRWRVWAYCFLFRYVLPHPRLTLAVVGLCVIGALAVVLPHVPDHRTSPQMAMVTPLGHPTLPPNRIMRAGEASGNIGLAGGDLSGTFPSPAIADIVTLSDTKFLTNKIFTGNGAWSAEPVSARRIR